MMTSLLKMFRQLISLWKKFAKDCRTVFSQILLWLLVQAFRHQQGSRIFELLEPVFMTTYKTGIYISRLSCFILYDIYIIIPGIFYFPLKAYNLPTAESVFDINYFKENPFPFYQISKELLTGYGYKQILSDICPGSILKTIAADCSWLHSWL